MQYARGEMMLLVAMQESKPIDLGSAISGIVLDRNGGMLRIILFFRIRQCDHMDEQRRALFLNDMIVAVRLVEQEEFTLFSSRNDYIVEMFQCFEISDSKAALFMLFIEKGIAFFFEF